MRGDLSRTSAADACRELARQAATGLLAIEGPEGPGSVSMVEGRIVAASSPTPRARLGDRLVGASYLDEQDLAEALRLQRSGVDHARLGVLLVERGLVSRDAVRLFIQEQMLDALFDVLFWRYGSFEFIHGEATEVLEVPLSIAVDDMLVEVARRQQEWEQVRQVIPDLESVPAFRVGASSAAAALEPDEFAILASVDGERSVRTLASDLGYGEFEAARIVYGLCLLGIVEVRLPEDEVGAAFDDAFAATPGDADDADTEDDAARSDPGADVAPGVGVDPVTPVEHGPVDEEAAAQLDTDLSDLLAELTGARDEDGEEQTDEPEPFSAMIDDPEATAASWQRGGTWADSRDEEEPPAPSRTWAIDDERDDGYAATWEPPDQPEPAGGPPDEPPPDQPVRDPADLPPPDQPVRDPAGGPPDQPERAGGPPDQAEPAGGPPDEPPPDQPVRDAADLPPPDQPEPALGAADPAPAEVDRGSAGPSHEPPAPPADRSPAAAGPAADAGDDTDELRPVGQDPQARRDPGPAEAPESLPPPHAAPREPAPQPARPSQRGGGPGSTFVEDPTPAPTATPAAPYDEPIPEEPARTPDQEPDRAPPSDDVDAGTRTDADEDADEDSAASSGDVSEFLRELSRLALDGDEDDRPRPTSAPPRGPRPQRDDDKPKKRGLFGWGG